MWQYILFMALLLLFLFICDITVLVWMVLHTSQYQFIPLEVHVFVSYVMKCSCRVVGHGIA